MGGIISSGLNLRRRLFGGEPLTERDAFDAAMQAGAGRTESLPPLTEPAQSSPVAVGNQPLRNDLLNSVQVNTAGDGRLFEPRPARDLSPVVALDESLNPALKAAADRNYLALDEPTPTTAQPSPSLTEQDPRARLGAAAADVMPGRAQQRAMAMLREPAEQHKGQHVGFGERVMHGLKEGGKVLALTRNPFDAVAGLVSGVADPDSYHRLNRQLALPGALSEAAAENQMQAGNMNRAHSYEALTERDPYSNKLTLQGQVHSAQIGNYASEDERRRAQTENDAVKRALDTFDSWAKYAAPGSKVPDEIASAARLPRGSTVWHNTQTGEHYVKDPNGRTVQLKDGKGYPVNYADTNEPVYEHVPPPREPQTPQHVLDGLASAEIMKEMGITDLNAQVDNPAFSDALARQKASEEESSKRYGYPMPSDAEIAATVAKKVPPKIKAGAQITPEMIRQRAAQIYQRQRAAASGPAPAASPASPSQSSLKAQRRQQEQLYQQNYDRLAPEKRAQFEQLFKQQFGRLPRRAH